MCVIILLLYLYFVQMCINLFLHFRFLFCFQFFSWFSEVENRIAESGLEFCSHLPLRSVGVLGVHHHTVVLDDLGF